MNPYTLFPHLLAPKYLGWLVDGLGMTLFVSAIVAVLATFIGFFLAAARSSTRRALAAPAAAYISVFRNLPLLVQLFFWYFAAPGFLPAGWLDWLNSPHRVALAGGLTLAWPSFEFLAAAFGLTLYSTAFVAEEIRAGMRGVPENQRLSAQSLGMSRLQVLRYVVLPQALRIALTPLFGQYMNIVKNSSLTMAIGLVELSYASRQVETETFRTFQAFGIATLFYVLTIAALEGISQTLKRRFALASEERTP